MKVCEECPCYPDVLKFWHEFAVETTHCVPGQEPGTNFSLQWNLDLEDTDIAENLDLKDSLLPPVSTELSHKNLPHKNKNPTKISGKKLGFVALPSLPALQVLVDPLEVLQKAGLAGVVLLQEHHLELPENVLSQDLNLLVGHEQVVAPRNLRKTNDLKISSLFLLNEKSGKISKKMFQKIFEKKVEIALSQAKISVNSKRPPKPTNVPVLLSLVRLSLGPPEKTQQYKQKHNFSEFYRQN